MTADVNDQGEVICSKADKVDNKLRLAQVVDIQVLGHS